MTMVLTTFIKYMLHTIDLQSENPWDNKAVYMLYTELFTGRRLLCFSSLSQPAKVLKCSLFFFFFKKTQQLFIHTLPP